MIQIMRNANRMVLGIREKMETVDKILDLVKDKLEKGSSHLGMLADTALKLTGYFLADSKKKPGKKKK
ncbi:hypothetical protein CL634_02000 [bacterium]|nr:hypothetical protein [bacterium]